MDNLVHNHELWIHGPSLGPSAGYIPGWAREPVWSHQGLTLMRASETAHHALEQASVALAKEVIGMLNRQLPSGWPPLDTGPPGRPAQSHAPGLPPSLHQAPDR